MSWQLVALGLGLALIVCATIAWALWVWRDLELAYRRQRAASWPRRDLADKDTEVLR